ncbi:MAG: hypothetical protein ACK4KV_08970 [Rhodocyclaceae bacterium]
MNIFPRAFNKKTVKTILLYFLASITVNAFAGDKTTIDVERHIGLYEVVRSACDMAEGDLDFCKRVLFFEIVKGQFVGIDDDQIAYVFWSGDPEIDPELQYTSHLIRDDVSIRIDDHRLVLSEDSEAKEYLVFIDGALSEYHSEYKTGDRTNSRTIRYTLRPVRRGNLPLVRMNYPGK